MSARKPTSRPLKRPAKGQADAKRAQQTSANSSGTQRTTPRILQARFEWLPPRTPGFYAGLLFALVVVLYINTLGNRYALDDGLVVTENSYTKMGFGGIGKLLTTDSFAGTFGDDANILAGGRWRPLSLVTFAIEYQFTGDGPAAATLSHLINVLLFALLCWVLWRWFLETVWPGRADLAFLAAALFVIHPIHTEAVANLKGRDEIMSLLFLGLTLLLSSRALQQGRDHLTGMVGAGFCFLLALLSKENGVTFLAILPLSFYFFSRREPAGIIKLMLPFVIITALYLALRTSVIGFSMEGKSQDVLNQPYILASAAEKYATIIYVQLKYIGLMFWPHPLTFDYSFKQIPYYNFGSLLVWASVLVHGLMVAFAVWGTKRRLPAAFGVWFYLLSMSIFTNIVINLGAFMGERLLFQPSVGFCIAVAAGIGWLVLKLQDIDTQKIVFRVVLVLLLIPSALKVWSRNPDWKDNPTLFLTDVKHSPMSAKANKGAGEALISIARDDSLAKHDKPKLREAVAYLNKSIEIHPEFTDAYLDKGAALYMLERYDEAEKTWNDAAAISPNNSTLRKHFDLLAQYHFAIAQRKFANKDYDSTLFYANKAAQYERTNGKPWYLKGVTYGVLQRFDAAIAVLDTAIAREPQNAEYYYNKGGIAYNAGRFDVSAQAMEQTLRINPQYPQAADALRAARQRIQFPRP